MGAPGTFATVRFGAVHPRKLPFADAASEPFSMAGAGTFWAVRFRVTTLRKPPFLIRVDGCFIGLCSRGLPDRRA